MIRRVVELIGHGQTEADAGDGCVDTDDVPLGIGQRPAGAPGIEGRVGLDDVLDHAGCGPTARAGSELPRPLTTPAVTQPASPSGLPTATTSGRRPARPRRRTGGVGIVLSARTHGQVGQGVDADDVDGRAVVPSGNAACPRRPPPTTWALVIRRPSSVSTTADPADSPRQPRIRSEATSVASVLRQRRPRSPSRRPGGPRTHPTRAAGESVPRSPRAQPGSGFVTGR